MSRDHSREVQGTNEHATMPASKQHIKLIFRDGQIVYIVRARGALQAPAEAREPVSTGQICIWARMCKWCHVLSLGGLHH
jgi:hypothetical protein